MSLVKYEKKGRVAYITLNRPNRLNVIDLKTAEELAKVWVDFRDDSQLWIAILGGEGASFCAGATLGGKNSASKWSLSKSLVYGRKRIGPSNYELWKPIVAAVHGYVLGAGLYLALECDLRIAAETAEFGLPEPKAGITTVFAPFLRDYLHHTHAMELLLVGDRVKAVRAYEMGLVNQVVPSERLIASAEAMAERICENGPLSVRGMKEVFYRSRNMDFNNTLSLMKQIFTPINNSEDAAEGISAFNEKRKPRWKCR